MNQLSYSLSPVALKADRHMGLDIMYVVGSKEYRVTDVNRISYFGASVEEIKALMNAKGRRTLKKRI